MFNSFKEKDKQTRFTIDNINYEISTIATGDMFCSYGHGKQLINLDKNKIVFRKYTYTDDLDRKDCDWKKDNRIFLENI